MQKIFGTDGIRGIANVDPMTTEMMVKVGRAAAHIFKEKGKGRHRIVIGKDTRLSGYMLENALIAGICSMGVDVLQVGPLPTPGIAFITTGMRADAGVVISASHNPFQDNGIKFFSRDGYKLPDEIELEIERHVFGDLIEHIRPTATAVGKAYRIDDAVGRYIVHLKTKFPKGLTLEGLKIVVDCANGAAYKVAPAVFEELGAQVIAVGVEPNGENINHECGSLHPENVAERVKREGAHLGIALDGDADRLILADQRGERIDGDQVMALVARSWHAGGRLANGGIVATVMSNLGLERYLNELGLGLERTPVGDRYVVEYMRLKGFNVGGEQSGHIVLSDYSTTGDGLIAALQVLEVLVDADRPADEVLRAFEPLPQLIRNVSCAASTLQAQDVRAAIADGEAALGDSGRLVIRQSGTEPVVRVMAEGEDEGQVAQVVDSIVASIEASAG